MAKTKGALLSHDAQGTFADLLTYQKTGGVRHAHKKLQRKDPRSTGQLTRRASFQNIVSRWGLMTTSMKEVYNTRAKDAGFISGYHLYMSEQIIYPYPHCKFGGGVFGEYYKFGSN